MSELLRTPCPTESVVIAALLASEKSRHNSLVSKTSAPGSTLTNVFHKLYRHQFIEYKWIPTGSKDQAKKYWFVDSAKSDELFQRGKKGIDVFFLGDKLFPDFKDSAKKTFETLLKEIALEILVEGKLPLWKKLLSNRHHNDRHTEKEYVVLTELSDMKWLCFSRWDNRISSKLDGEFQFVQPLFELNEGFKPHGLIELSDFGVFFFFNHLMETARDVGRVLPLGERISRVTSYSKLCGLLQTNS